MQGIIRLGTTEQEMAEAASKPGDYFIWDLSEHGFIEQVEEPA